MTNRIREWFNTAPTVPWIGRFAIAAVVATMSLAAVALGLFLRYGDEGWDEHPRPAASSGARGPSTTAEGDKAVDPNAQPGDTSGCRPHATAEELLVCATDNSEADLKAAGRLDATTRGSAALDERSANETCDETGDAGPTLPTAHLGSDWTTYQPDLANFPVAFELPDGWSVEQDQGVRAVLASDDETGAVVVLADFGAGANAQRLPQMMVDEFGGEVRLLGTDSDEVNGVDVCRSLFDAGGLAVETVAFDVDGHSIVAGAVWWDSLADGEVELARTVLASIDIGGAA
jgi:hypothetical protein